MDWEKTELNTRIVSFVGIGHLIAQKVRAYKSFKYTMIGPSNE